MSVHCLSIHLLPFTQSNGQCLGPNTTEMDKKKKNQVMSGHSAFFSVNVTPGEGAGVFCRSCVCGEISAASSR